MKHKLSLEGYAYRLRPIQSDDAEFVIQVRLEDPDRNRFLHSIPNDIQLQKDWINQYYLRSGDYYFVIENRLTGKKEGLIAFYNESNGKAEWGRWVLKKGSLAAIESVYLLYRIAFEQIGLNELYCLTLSDNKSVVAFHTSLGEKTRSINEQFVEMDGEKKPCVEQYSDRDNFYEKIAPNAIRQSQRVFLHNLQGELGSFSFHHVGVATRNIARELPFYTLLGYKPESNTFEDPFQKIRGMFLIAKNQPRLELLENMDDSHTLDIPLKQGQKYYHLAYQTENIEAAIEIFKRNRARVISEMKPSVYFGKRICFLILPNMGMIELIEI